MAASPGSTVRYGDTGEQVKAVQEAAVKYLEAHHLSVRHVGGAKSYQAALSRQGDNATFGWRTKAVLDAVERNEHRHDTSIKRDGGAAFGPQLARALRVASPDAEGSGVRTSTARVAKVKAPEPAAAPARIEAPPPVAPRSPDVPARADGGAPVVSPPVTARSIQPVPNPLPAKAPEASPPADVTFAGQNVKLAKPVVQSGAVDPALLSPNITRNTGELVSGPLIDGAKRVHSIDLRAPTPPTPAAPAAPTPQVAPMPPVREPSAPRKVESAAPTAQAAPMRASGWPHKIDVDAMVAKLASQGIRNTAGARTMLTALNNYAAKFPADAAARRPVVMFNDYDTNRNQPRGFLINLKTGALEMKPMGVAQGRGSGDVNGRPVRFDNVNGHGTSVLGLMVAGGVSPFDSHLVGGVVDHTSKVYVEGVTPGMNDGVQFDGKWVHGARYNSATTGGPHSLGCPSVSLELIKTLGPKLERGFVFNYASISNPAVLTNVAAPAESDPRSGRAPSIRRAGYEDGRRVVVASAGRRPHTRRT